MSRPSRDEGWALVLQALQQRGTCVRRQTACLIVDENNRLLSLGYNGVAPGFPHCNEGNPCYPGAAPGSAVSGDAGNESSNCEANHAEASCLVWLPDPRLAKSLYCTNLPCHSCAKLILQTAVTYVYALEDYPDHRGLELLLRKPGMEVRVTNVGYRKLGNYTSKYEVG
jgi:dCMP deaminase